MGICPVKIKPASILASIQNRGAQWTQAPDRDTDTLPRITGHGPVRSTPKALCCFKNFRLVSLPSSPLCSDSSVFLCKNSTAASESHGRLITTSLNKATFKDN